MILDDKVKIPYNSRYKKYYEDLGYIFENKEAIVLVTDLQPNSLVKILIKCDFCGKEKYVRYSDYQKITKKRTENYYCQKCVKITKTRFTIIDKYGVDNVFQLEETKDKIKISNLELYGVENPQQNKEIKDKTEKTNLERYGVKNPFQSEEVKKIIKKTNLKKYGVEYPSQSDEIRFKMGETSLKNYGFEYPTQNREHYYNRLKNSVDRHYIEELHYQGSYEKDFIMRYKDKVKIENGLSIEYYYLDEKKIYHSDFYIPEYDLVVEVKSTYWFDIHKEQCKAKEEYTKKSHNYIMVLDKNYDILDAIVSLKNLVVN